jgi:hypothetical protein
VTPTLPAQLKADCASCAGLCCVVPPFDAVQGFGFDKPAQTPCHHLCADFRCGIHDRLEAEGFVGCAAFDCLGAGQRLTAQARERFGDADWRARPEVAAWLFAAYPLARELHELHAQLSLTEGLLPGPLHAELMAEIASAEHDLGRVTAEQLQTWRARATALFAGLAKRR